MDICGHWILFSATHCVNEHFLEKLKILGGTYVLPLSVNYRGIFYNKKLLEEEGYQIPSTYAELIDTMQQIKKAGKLPIIFADKDRLDDSSGVGCD